MFYREWILENKGCPFCKTPIIPEDTNTIPRINNLNNDIINENQNVGNNLNINLQENLNNAYSNENKTSNESTTKADSFNNQINPHFEKIKMYKENLKSKIALENTAIDSLKQSYDEKQYLSNFPSGSVEYGLPCEVVYNRSLEV